MRELQQDLIKSKGGPTSIPKIIDDSRTLKQEALDYDKAILRGEYIKTPEGIQLTSVGDEGTNITGFNVNNPSDMAELKLKTGSDLKYSYEKDPTLIRDFFDE
tara:strand:+ start:1736 stop:2044 length:309 start_codon:yes stop_codon:yes gene_type:complete